MARGAAPKKKEAARRPGKTAAVGKNAPAKKKLSRAESKKLADATLLKTRAARQVPKVSPKPKSKAVSFAPTTKPSPLREMAEDDEDDDSEEDEAEELEEKKPFHPARVP